MQQIEIQLIRRHLQVVSVRARSTGAGGDTPVKLDLPAGGLYAWLRAMPFESLHRLRVINSNTASSRHIIQALAFGLIDSNIRRLNRMITHLLLTRMRAERDGKTQTITRINELMEDMHAVIDRVTGIERAHCENKSVCNRPQRLRAGRIGECMR